MFTATNARIASIDSSTVETELALININIVNAVNNNQTSVQVSGNTTTVFGSNIVVGTPMTLDANYYSTWQTATDKELPSLPGYLAMKGPYKLALSVSNNVAWKESEFAT